MTENQIELRLQCLKLAVSVATVCVTVDPHTKCDIAPMAQKFWEFIMYLDPELPIRHNNNTA